MKKYAFLLLLLWPVLASAQKDRRHQATLYAGTAITLEVAEDISSSQASPNDRIAFRVSGHLKADQHILIQDGANAWGRVLGVHKTTYNTPEYIQYEVIMIADAEGRQIAVYSGHLQAKAEHVGMTAWLRAGKKVTAYVWEDVKFRIQK